MFQHSHTFSVPNLAGLDSTGAVPGFVGRSGEGVCSVQGVHSRGNWRVYTVCTLHIYIHTFTFYDRCHSILFRMNSYYNYSYCT